MLARTAQRHAGRPPGNLCEPGTLLSLGRPGLLKTLLNNNAFVDVQLVTLAAPFALPSLQHHIDFVCSAAAPVIALLQPLAPAAQVAAWTDVRAQLQAYTTATGWCGPNRLLLCSATAPG